MLEQVVKIVALHDHIVEFQEGEALFHALLVAFGAQHIVHAEARAHFAKQFHIVQRQQPICIVQHHGLALAKLNKVFHLALEAFGVVVNIFPRQHLAHVGAPGGGADHGGAAAQKGNGLVARLLKALHQRQRHKMPGRQAVGSAVETDVERCLAVVDQFLDFFLVRHLCNEATGLEFVIDCHEKNLL